MVLYVIYISIKLKEKIKKLGKINTSHLLHLGVAM